ncbi:MAG: GTP-binding protein, partial [Lachnospiraceae bacterium]
EEECECGHHHHHDEEEECECGHHHHHDEEEECECGHHHHHDEEEECECGHHHHHDEEEECECGHHHHHDEEEECSCGHHHHHHADDVFTSWGMETIRSFTEDEIRQRLEQLEDFTVYGTVLRAKGMVAGTNGAWVHFDYVPEEWEVRTGAADVTGKICVIGAKLNEEALKQLFNK